MRPIPIADLADVHRIEATPYTDFMPYATVLDALEASAARHADRTALSYVQSVQPELILRHWRYTEFITEVRRAGRLFRALAGGETPRVAMLLPAIPEACFTLWGAEAVGVACPINYLLGEDHIADLINASGANVVVALGPNEELDIWSKVVGLPQRCPGLRHLVAVGAAVQGATLFAEGCAAQPADPLAPHERSSGDVVAMFHTGGTTGQPKLAQHLHRNQLHAAWGAACLYSATEDDVIVNGFPMFHVAGSFVYGLSMLLTGAQIVLPSLLGYRNRQMIDRYWELVETCQATLLAAVPTVMSSLLTVPLRPAQVRSVRCLLTGGSSLPAELAAAFEAQTGIAVRNILGMTECGGVIAIEPTAGPRTPGAVGLPLPYATVEVRDDEGHALPQGADGVVWVKGPHVGPGYTDADRNAGTFTPDGWLVTGDVGHIGTDGRLFITGRAKDLIIRSSHNIDPVVIEDALLRHPDVLMAAAVGAPDAYAGEVPVAYVSCKPGSHIGADALRQFALQHIPERPAYPKSVTVLESLPCTAIGKIFKPTLRALAAEAVLAEAVKSLPAAAGITVKLVQEGKGMIAEFHGVADAAVRQQIEALMVPYALSYRFAGKAVS